MKWILRIKDVVKPFYEQYDNFINGLLKFSGALIVFLTVIYHTGYNTVISTPAVAVIGALVCAFIPPSLITVFMSVLLVAEFASVSIEATVILIFFLALMLLMYFIFRAGDSWLMPLTLVLCLFGVPAAVLPVALVISPVQVLVAAFGILLYGFVFIVKKDVSVLMSSNTSLNLPGRVNYLLNDLFMNKQFLIVMGCVCVSMLIISVIRRSKLNYSGLIGILVGDLVYLTAYLTCYYLMELIFSPVPFVIAYALNIVFSFVILNFAINMDYKRTEQVQFEDDEYYYYVKAVPKVSIHATKKTVKNITTEPDVTDSIDRVTPDAAVDFTGGREASQASETPETSRNDMNFDMIFDPREDGGERSGGHA